MEGEGGGREREREEEEEGGRKRVYVCGVCVWLVGAAGRLMVVCSTLLGSRTKESSRRGSRGV